jgi:hypothetical protein
VKNQKNATVLWLNLKSGGKRFSLTMTTMKTGAIILYQQRRMIMIDVEEAYKKWVESPLGVNCQNTEILKHEEYRRVLLAVMKQAFIAGFYSNEQ